MLRLHQYPFRHLKCLASCQNIDVIVASLQSDEFSPCMWLVMGFDSLRWKNYSTREALGMGILIRLQGVDALGSQFELRNEPLD